MIINRNEKYLLKFISCASLNSNSNEDLIKTVCSLGIELKFNNTNSVYQIIDELNFKSYKNQLVGK